MDADVEDDGDDGGACDVAEIHGGRQKTKRLACVFRLGDLDGDGLADWHDEMFAKTPDHDEKSHNDFIGRDEEKRRAEHGNHRAQAEDFPVGHSVEKREQEDEREARHFTEEFKRTAILARHVMHVREEIVHRRGETTCADAPDDDAQEEGERGAFVFENVSEFHVCGWPARLGLDQMMSQLSYKVI